MLRAEVVVAELKRLPQSELEHLLGARSGRDLAAVNNASQGCADPNRQRIAARRISGQSNGRTGSGLPADGAVNRLQAPS